MTVSTPNADDQLDAPKTTLKEEKAKKTFEDFYLSDDVLKALRKMGYTRPTPVQHEAIPLILAGIDLIAQAQTGTGKTAAFAIPTVEMLEPNPGTVEVLVLCPTRELAKQVCHEFEQVGEYKDLHATSIYGGASYEKQYKALETAQIVSATPGRLLDHLKNGKIDLSELRLFALDEADEMLSMGFREELEAIVEFLPEERQSLLFSATVDETIKSLAKGMLYYPEFISLSSDSVAAEQVTHVYYRVKGVARSRDLLKVLDYENPESAIIFANTKADTFAVTDFLKRHGYRAEVLNGDLPQSERERTLGKLRDEKIDLLVATDVAARGIDISGLSHVFNYMLPNSAEVYVHRTGRTGRAGQAGRAVTLLSPAEMATHFDIQTLYDIDITTRELPTADEILQAKEASRLSIVQRSVARLEPLPYGGKLGLAKAFLEEKSADDEKAVELVARLFALADRVTREEALAKAVTGPPGRITQAPAAPTPEAKPRRQPAEETAAEPEARAEAPQKTEEKAAPTEEVQAEQPADEEKPRRRRRRRSGGGDSQKTEESAEERSSTSSRRRRRSRGSKASRRKSRGESKGSRKSSGRKSSGRKSSGRKSSGRKSSGRKSSGRKSRGTSNTRKVSTDFDTQKMYMNVGRDHFEGAEDLLEMISYMSGFGPEDFGDITVQSTYSFIEVHEDYFYDVIKALNNQDWKGVKLTAEPARK